MGQGTRKGTGTTSGVAVSPWARPRPGLVAAMGVALVAQGAEQPLFHFLWSQNTLFARCHFD